MPLCPQITNTPVTVTLTADFTVTDVVPVVPATTEDVANVVVLVDGKTKAYYQTTAPTSGMTEGDIWFDTDDGYKLYYYTGSAWTSVQDTSIAAAQSAATAAQTTADGKNRVYRQTTQPSGGTYAEGDLWFDTDDDNKIYRYTSGSWGTAVTLGNNALASISANKITAGTIDASVITVSNINAGNISTGTLAAARIAANSLDASKITAGTITATQISSSYVYAGTIAAGNITAGTVTASVAFNAASGTFSGTITASSGTIGGFTLSGGSLFSGNLTLSSSGTITGGNSSTLFYGYVNVGGDAPTGARFQVAGTSNFNGTITGLSIVANGTITYPGVATGAGTSMVVVTTGSRVAIVTSSERFKDQIKYINTTGWLDKVMQMKPITYKTSEDFTTEGEPNEEQIGFLAEDIYDIGGGLEKAVILDPLDEPFSLSYDRLTVFLTLAIKELKAEIDTLKGE